MQANGTQYEFSAGAYRAVVTEVGGRLRVLTHDGRELVKGFAADEVAPLSRGALLVPWPNRIADGRYDHAGASFQLPLTEPLRRNAIHGLLGFAAWNLAHHDASSVTLRHRLWPQTGYPFLLDLEVSYVLAADGLRWSISATNGGDVAAPYGCSIHPYVLAGPGPVDEWTLRVPASRWLAVDPDRLLPLDVHPVEDSDFDFRTARRIGSLQLDHAFTGIDFDADGLATAHVTATDGTGVAMSWDAACPWVQVHTADRPEPEYNRVALAIEPMTCPPDAFNSGTDLVLLQPGASHRVEWRIAAVTG